MLKYLYSYSDVMNLGGRCPLNNIKDRENFLRNEVEVFYKTQINNSDVERMRRVFCSKICKNIMC